MLPQLIEEFQKRSAENAAAECPIGFVHKFYERNRAQSELTETESIVRMLQEPMFHSGATARGKMILIRVDVNLQGRCIQQGLLLASKIAKKQCKMPEFAVIPDFGNLTLDKLETRYLVRLQAHAGACKTAGCACSRVELPDARSPQCKCGHVHQPVSMYEDLLHLPCIVLLNEKGRMGDTFPHSFACMDLRMRYQIPTARQTRGQTTSKNRTLYLRSVTQELGRLCRYVRPCVRDGELACAGCHAPYAKDRAYALVGSVLQQYLAKGYSMSTAQLQPSDRLVRTLHYRKMDELPPGISIAETHQPTEDSYDWMPAGVTRTLKHKRRFVLQAECQIGKTGTYLSILWLLNGMVRDAPRREQFPVLIPSSEICKDDHPRESFFARQSSCQGMPAYKELAVGKYHAHILYERLRHVLLSKHAGGNWGQKYSDWIFDVDGEFALCQGAKTAAAKMMSALSTADQHRALFCALDWDERMSRPVRKLQPPRDFLRIEEASIVERAAAGAVTQYDGNAIVRELMQQASGNASSNSGAVSLPSRPVQQLWQSALPKRYGVVESNSIIRSNVAGGSRAAHAQSPSQRVLQYKWSKKRTTEAGDPLIAASNIRISVPSIERARSLFVLSADEQFIVKPKEGDAHGVRYWIANCTFNRRGRALLDYSNVMDGLSFRQLIICRKERFDVEGRLHAEFDDQVAEWGGTHVIVEIPAETCFYPIYDGSQTRYVPVSAEKGGIGFARYFAQLLADEWELPAIWMLDDNVLRFIEAEIQQAGRPALLAAAAMAAASGREADQSNARLDVHACSFAKVMRVLEQMIDPSPELRKQIGDPNKYALLGTHRDSRIYQMPTQRDSLLRRPHARTHCYSAILLHIRACFKNPNRLVLFPPRMFWEDIELNHLANEAGLWIVKYRRFCHEKKNFTPCFALEEEPWQSMPLEEAEEDVEQWKFIQWKQQDLVQGVADAMDISSSAAAPAIPTDAVSASELQPTEEVRDRVMQLLSLHSSEELHCLLNPVPQRLRELLRPNEARITFIKPMHVHIDAATMSEARYFDDLRDWFYHLIHLTSLPDLQVLLTVPLRSLRECLAKAMVGSPDSEVAISTNPCRVSAVLAALQRDEKNTDKISKAKVYCSLLSDSSHAGSGHPCGGWLLVCIERADHAQKLQQELLDAKNLQSPKRKRAGSGLSAANSPSACDANRAAAAAAASSSQDHNSLASAAKKQKTRASPASTHSAAGSAAAASAATATGTVHTVPTAGAAAAAGAVAARGAGSSLLFTKSEKTAMGRVLKRYKVGDRITLPDKAQLSQLELELQAAMQQLPTPVGQPPKTGSQCIERIRTILKRSKPKHITLVHSWEQM